MIKKVLTISALFLTIAFKAVAKDLPDFTELAEKQGPTVLNIVTGKQIGRAHV